MITVCALESTSLIRRMSAANARASGFRFASLRGDSLPVPEPFPSCTRENRSKSRFTQSGA